MPTHGDLVDAVRQMSFSSISPSMCRLTSGDIGEYILGLLQQRSGVVHSLGTVLVEADEYSLRRLRSDTIVGFLKGALDVFENFSLLFIVAVLGQGLADQGQRPSHPFEDLVRLVLFPQCRDGEA